ncbi:diguanylate cyclase [Sphingosinithalassobacter sp. CS137]|uniref:sensor domain-containing diguanylate cyclase n=1 Tax=Sphingosinithalassobacter sp. CS137 TaxID=2762748 RepID=UPI00165E8846|nr:diguanylate cyclase [Sphingosinithalassobacter sp. CS137]
MGSGRGLLLWALGLLCLSAALLAPAPSRAAGGVVGTPLRVCILPAEPGMDPATLLRQPERFDCATPQAEFGSGDYWVLSSDIGERSRARRPLTVRIASVWQRGLDVHVLYADGEVATETADASGISRHIELGAIVEHELPLRKAEVVRVLWHVKDAANLRGILIGPRLATRDQSTQSNLVMGAVYAAFGGLCIALVVYNLALWGALRHRFQLAYCAMVGGLLIYAVSSSGALAWLWPEIANTTRLRVNHLMLALSGAAALVFARTFFEARVFEGWMGRLTTAMVVALVTAGFGFFLFAPYAIHLADRLYALIFLAVPAVLAPMLWRAWRQRSNYLWLFAVAWALPISTAVARALHNLGLIPWNFWLDNSTILSMAAEALISSLAIAYRIRILSRERDEAITAETMARRLAETDPLTGLLNRRAFLEHSIGRTGRQTLLIADIDHFKRVNDTLGHDGGDEVLRVFARVLRASVPASALVARLGGEEFAIITHSDEPVPAEALLARLRAARMPFDLSVTASVGVCSGPLATEIEWKTLYRGADAALFDAKAAGRDRARAARPETPAAAA